MKSNVGRRLHFGLYFSFHILSICVSFPPLITTHLDEVVVRKERGKSNTSSSVSAQRPGPAQHKSGRDRAGQGVPGSKDRFSHSTSSPNLWPCKCHPFVSSSKRRCPSHRNFLIGHTRIPLNNNHKNSCREWLWTPGRRTAADVGLRQTTQRQPMDIPWRFYLARLCTEQAGPLQHHSWRVAVAGGKQEKTV
jgi:hypothetical protein